MKRLILLLCLISSFAFGQTQLELPYSIKVLNPKPLDAYYYNTSFTPYTSTSQVTSQIPVSVRFRGMLVNVNGVEYWFENGVTDIDLVPKTFWKTNGQTLLDGFVQIISNHPTDGLQLLTQDAPDPDADSYALMTMTPTGVSLNGGINSVGASSQISVNSSGNAVIFTSNPNGTAEIDINSTGTTLTVFDASTDNGVNFTSQPNSPSIFNSNYGLTVGVFSGLPLSDFHGIQYAADFSANFTDFSLINKAYLNAAIAAAAFVPTNGNGTTANGSAVDLGGTISNDIFITDSGTGKIFNLQAGRVQALSSHSFIWMDYNGEDPDESVRIHSSGVVDLTAPNLSLNGNTTFHLIGANTRINLGDTDFNIQDDRGGVTQVGLEYKADYSANFTDLSLVNKAWVLSQVGSGSWPLTGTATFTGDVDINTTSSHGFRMQSNFDETSPISSFDFIPGSNIAFSMGDGTTASSQVLNYNKWHALVTDLSNEKRIDMQTNITGIVVTDGISSRGFVYTSDYSSSATNRWIPDKGYGDTHLAGTDFTNSPSSGNVPTFNGTNWTFSTPSGGGSVSSVFGRTGAVTATSGDYSTSQVTEVTNLYYTDARARASNSFTTGSGAYNSSTGVITIPTNTNELTNGAGFVTASSSTAFTNKTGNISQWTNDSGYITGSSSTALTNKTGNISQWTNDSGYITASSSSALTNKTGNISQWTNDSGYSTWTGQFLECACEGVTATPDYTDACTQSFTFHGFTIYLANTSDDYFMWIGGSGTHTIQWIADQSKMPDVSVNPYDYILITQNISTPYKLLNITGGGGAVNGSGSLRLDGYILNIVYVTNAGSHEAGTDYHGFWHITN